MKLFVRHGSDQMHAPAEPLPGNLRRGLTTAAALADNRQLKVILAQSCGDNGQRTNEKIETLVGRQIPHRKNGL